MSESALETGAHRRSPKLEPGEEPAPRKLTGEERLALAVFEDGIDIVRGAKLTTTQQRATDEAWFTDSTGGPFGFVWLCEAFGYDPSAVREAVRKQQGKPVARYMPRLRIDGGLDVRKRRGAVDRWRD